MSMDERTPDDPKYREQMARVMAAELPEKWEREPMDDATIRSITCLREWLLSLTGKDFWVRRINGQFIAVFESARLSAGTYEQAREQWAHALTLYGWVKEGGECQA